MESARPSPSGYAAAGAAVCCVARTRSDLERTVSEIRQHGGTAISIQADVTNYASVVQAFDTAASEFGGIDIVVINAGGNYDDSHDIESGSSRAVGEHRSGQPDRLLPHRPRRNTAPQKAWWPARSSPSAPVIGHRGRPGESAYASAKAGLSMLMRVLAQELWQHNISVNELIPGPVLTERVARTFADRPDSVFQIDSEWIKTPEDVVPLALFLATQPPQRPHRPDLQPHAPRPLAARFANREVSGPTM